MNEDGPLATELPIVTLFRQSRSALINEELLRREHALQLAALALHRRVVLVAACAAINAVLRLL